MDTLTKQIREQIYNELIDNHYVNFNINDNMFFIVLMFDYYNFLYLRQAIGDINGWDIQFIQLLELFTFEELLEFFKNNSYFIKQSLCDNYKFNNLTNIEKQNLMYDLHFNNEKNVITNNYFYISDMLGYFPCDKLIDLEKNFHEFIKINNLDINSSIDQLLINLEALKKIDYDKYKEIKLEIIYSFYKIEKYKLKETKNIKTKDRIYHFLIKNLSDNKILQYSEKHSDFEYSVLMSHFSTKEIVGPIIYNQIISESEKDMSKKLIKKFNNNKKES